MNDASLQIVIVIATVGVILMLGMLGKTLESRMIELIGVLRQIEINQRGKL